MAPAPGTTGEQHLAANYSRAGATPDLSLYLGLTLPPQTKTPRLHIQTALHTLTNLILPVFTQTIFIIRNSVLNGMKLLQCQYKSE